MSTSPQNPISRAMKAVKFAQSHRYWTDYELAEALDISPVMAGRYRDVMSVHFTVRCFREANHQKNQQPALYGIEK